MRGRLVNWKINRSLTRHTYSKTAQLGYLLPIVIALGLGVSTLSVVALQTVSTNSSSLNNQSYNELAREAAQAGISAALSCIQSGAMNLSGSPTWDTTSLTPDKGCDLKTVPLRPATVAGNDSSNPNNSLYTTTYSVAKPTVSGSSSNAYLITSVGKVSIKGPGGTTVSTIDQTLHAFGTTTPGTTTGAWKFASSISTGPQTACVVTAGGDNWVYCWGDNSNGQLGIGKNVPNNVWGSPLAVASGPVPAQGALPNPCGGWFQPTCTTQASPAYPASDMNGKKVIKVTVGTNHTCAIAAEQDGSKPRAYCWGNNSNGQLGNFSTNSSAIPVAVDATQGQPAVTHIPNPCGGWFQPTCDPVIDVPTKPDSALYNKDVTDISAGQNFTCALTSDGMVSCWGTNGNGQLGTNNRTQYTLPTNVYKSDYIAAQPAVTHIPNPCGGWFQPTCDPIVDSPATPAYAATPFWTKKAVKLAIVKGADNMCAIMDDGSSTCWGENYSGQTGNGRHAASSSNSACSGGNTTSVPPVSTAYDTLAPAIVQTSQKFDSITLTSGSDYGYATARTADTQRLYWWGGSTSGTSSRGAVCGHGGGGGTGQGPGNNKFTWTSTRNYNAQDTPSGPLYNNSTENPTTLNNRALALVSGVSAGGLLCAQLATSELYCDSHGDTGNSNDGELGNGYVYTCGGWFCAGPTNFTTPQKVAMDNTVYSVDGQNVKSDLAGQTLVTMDTGLSGYTCAVTTAGKVACWGVNNYGQLGVGDNIRRGVPTYVDVQAATSALYTAGGTTAAGRTLQNVVVF